jgi:small-conductance mechanosensitive channel
MDIIVAVVVLVVGWLLIQFVRRLLERAAKRAQQSEVLEQFVIKFVTILLYVALILVVLSIVGVSTAAAAVSISALLGLILGFGMQDSVANIASGIWLAMLNPMDRGEAVDLNGIVGSVSSVGILATQLLTFDNKYVTVPNKVVWSNAIINYSRMPTRRIEVFVGISYDADLKRAIAVAMEVMKAHELVLEEPEPMILVTELGDSSVNMSLRCWIEKENILAVPSQLYQQVFERFASEGIEIPYPQMDVHMK